MSEVNTTDGYGGDFCEVCGEWAESILFTGMIGDGPSLSHCAEPYCRRVAFNRVNGYPDEKMWEDAP